MLFRFHTPSSGFHQNILHQVGFINPAIQGSTWGNDSMGNFNHMFYQAKFSQTLPKTNMAMENDNFQQEIHLQMVDVPLPY